MAHNRKASHCLRVPSISLPKGISCGGPAVGNISNLPGNVLLQPTWPRRPGLLQQSVEAAGGLLHGRGFQDRHTVRSGRACGSGVQRKERRVDRGAQQGSRRMFALEEGVSPGKGTVDAPPGCPALVGISRYCSSRSGASSQRLIPAQKGAQQVSSALFARPCPSSTCAGAPSSPGQLRGTRSSPHSAWLQLAPWAQLRENCSAHLGIAQRAGAGTLHGPSSWRLQSPTDPTILPPQPQAED